MSRPDGHDDGTRYRLALLDTLLEQAPIHMAFVGLDLRFIEVNDHVADTHGRPAPDHVGRSLREVVGDEVAPHLEEHVERVLETGEPLVAREVAGPFPTGEKAFRITYYPVRSPAGETVGVAVLGVEVTQERHEFARKRDEAERTSAEYRRALRDYTQLTRHRLANPLTALTGGVATLIDLDGVLDAETRMQVLHAMRDTAERLERAVLHPELVSDEEVELRPVPELSRHTVARMIGADAVEAEQHFREINEAVIEQVGAAVDHELEVFCECWAMDCTSRVRLSIGDYFGIHDREDQFVISPGHVLPTVEHVVDRREEWWVVRKFEQAMQAARGMDGRR